MKRLVIGMTAHVDSGKTTLAEALLYKSGEIRKLGRVDNKDTFLDNHTIEKNRGITVFSKQAVMHTADSEFTLLDTPGHVDFSAETERAFRVLDLAVLVISGLDGVQSHTETLWRLLNCYGIPVIVFVNKMDISDYDKEYLLNNLKKRLSDRITDFSERNDENIALASEELMESYLSEGVVSDGMIASAVMSRKIFPCYFGSALKLKGIDELLDGIERYTEEADENNDFGAVVYKISNDNGVKLTHLKITGGSLKVKTSLPVGKDNTEEKINQIRIYSGAKFTPVNEVFQGQVCAVTGITEALAGDGLGFEENYSEPALEPVLNYRVICPSDTDVNTVISRLRQLEEENPELHIVWNEQLQEIHVMLMGEIQLEILKTLVKERFDMDIDFDRGSIAYKETIAEKVEGIGHYEPLRHYAEVHLILEPLPYGSGLVFDSEVSTDRLDLNWQRLILTHLQEKTHIGVLTGSPITDMKITLTDGRAHLKHTEGGDFRQATYRAVRMGLRSAQSVILEPYYSFKLEIPSESVGRALSDLQRIDAKFSMPDTTGEITVIEGKSSVESLIGYHTDVAAYTKGRGHLTCVFDGYYPCKNPEAVIEKIGYDCERDLDNTADSVFCSHGAGFAVKWDEVKNYMHLESTLKTEKTESKEYSSPKPVSRSVSYDDKELMAIFERTYGKIRRNERTAMRREKTLEKDSKGKPVKIPTGPEYLYVDGYNMIFAWDELKKLAESNLELARNTLTERLVNYQGYRKCNLVLVFDAYKVSGNHGSEKKVGNITVVYTKEHETADSYIERATHELGRNSRVRVATSDRLEQIIVLGNGAVRISASEFYEEVKSAEAAIKTIVDRNTAGNALAEINNKIILKGNTNNEEA